MITPKLRPCWICLQPTTDGLCPTCSASPDPDIIIYHDASGERLDPGEAHEAAAYYVTVVHDAPDEAQR